METKYFDYIERFLEQILPIFYLNKLDPQGKIEKFKSLFKKDIKIEAICDMASIEVEAMREEEVERQHSI